jgi:8-oxo-dGTP pyrophosphatase MutT (NUDIX family)
LLRDGKVGLEVLMVQRGLTARFMGGAWVFPGGMVDDLDSGDLARAVVSGTAAEGELRWIRAGLRELAEEVRIWITTDGTAVPPDGWLRDAAVYEMARERRLRFDADRAAYFANWITPTMIPVRFDTRFFAVEVGHDVVAEPDPRELADAEWLAPAFGLESARSRERIIPFPTMKTLEHIGRFSSAAEFMGHARELDIVPPIRPRGRISEDGSVEVVLPGEPGYEELGDAEPNSAALSNAAHAAQAGGHLAEVADRES